MAQGDEGSQCTFKERNRELQELVREYVLVRAHNLGCAARNDHASLLLLAEGALLSLVLERFVRVVVKDPSSKATLFSLLELAVKQGALTIPWDEVRDGIKRLSDVRNALMHANYEQAATLENLATPEEYFGSSRYAGTIERLRDVVDDLMRQIDPETGTPWSATRGEPQHEPVHEV